VTRRLAVFALTATLFSFASTAHAWPEPWADQDPPAPPVRVTYGEYGFRGGAEYRAQGTGIDPISLSAENDRRALWLEHRLRLDGTIDWEDKVRLTASVDALEAVVWGDNGDLGKLPEPDSGANVNTRNPNVGRICMQYKGGNALDAESYGLGVCQADPFFVRRLYGDLVTPVGLLRIGRQAFTEGNAVAVNDGNGRPNRFGISYRGNNVDRILFATKPLEGFKPKDQRDKSETKGMFLILAYDHLVNDKIASYGDNLANWITAVRFLAPEDRWGKDLELRVFHAYRWDNRNDSHIHAIGSRATSRFGDFYAGFDATVLLGRTREVSEAFKVINNDPPVSQDVKQFGGRAVVRYDRPKWTAYLEADYASGDSDPTGRTPLTQFRFAEDSNVGLLLFEHVLAFQSARAAAAAIELLKRLQAPTIPVEAVATRGSFTNAFAIFPQFDYRPVKNVLLRGGVMLAWAPGKVNDPVASQQRRDGINVDDDLVNFVGGKPGQFYGTELDARVQWRAHDHFAFDLEGAILFPGSALENADGYAARSVMVQGRTTFFF
jgi:hypothetical protein